MEEQRWQVDLVANGLDGERMAVASLTTGHSRHASSQEERLDVLRTLRSRGFDAILVRTAQDAVDAKVETLRAGADDT